jgi:predicted Zn-dependent peptidase
VVVGDIDVNAVLPMLEKHLGQIPAGEKPEGPVTVEPPQRAEKRIIMEDPAQPFLVIGYHRSDIMDPDDPVYDAISDILGGGRSSRLYTSLVKEKKLALFAGAAASVEGQKFPGLFAFFAVPNQGKSNAECEAAIYDEIERLKSEPVTEEELRGVKTRAKVRFIESVDSNMGIAMQLAFAQNLMGDWRQMFRSLERIDKVTPADIQRVAQKTFVKSNRTVGMIETVKEEAK